MIRKLTLDQVERVLKGKKSSSRKQLNCSRYDQFYDQFEQAGYYDQFRRSKEVFCYLYAKNPRLYKNNIAAI